MAGKGVATFSRSRLSTHEHEGEANEYKDHETRSVLDREPDALIRQFLPVTHKGPFRRSYGINDTSPGSFTPEPVHHHQQRFEHG